MLIAFTPSIVYVDGSFVRGLQAQVIKELKKHGDGDNEVSSQHLQRSFEITERIRKFADSLELPRTRRSIEWFEKHKDTETLTPSLSVFLHELRQLDLAIIADLREREFFHMPIAYATYYEQGDLFGKKVTEKFSSTVFDVSEAGNCYATGRYTACVFHCMRVLERGLHAFVRHLNNTHAAGIVFSKTVEETNWGNVIQEIQISLENPKRLARLSPLPTKDEMTQYSTAALEFEHFKQAWRDDVSHSRRSYDEPAAKSVMNHVQSFMGKISSWLSE